MRIENTGDNFDTKYRGENINGTAISVDLNDWATNFMQNSNAKPVNISQIIINELALSGNQLLSDMVKNKTNWITWAPGDVDRQPKGPQDKSATFITLVQQKIRLFNITYVLGSSGQHANKVHTIDD